MKRTIDRLIGTNHTASIAIGLIIAIGGVALAYFTNNTEPWGTIGGMACALGLIFAFYASANR